MDSIGRKLKEERQLRGWSQRDLARETGVNTDTISGIETGQHEPRPSTLRKLAEGLGIEVRDLFLEPVLPKAPAREAGQPKEEEGPLIDRPEVQEWLRGESHMTEEEFLSWIPTLDEPSVEDAIRAVREKRDELIDTLHTPETRRTLFPVPRGLSEEQTKAWLLKPPGRWELEWEIRHEYSARELALVNYSRQLFAAGEAEDYLTHVRDPDLHEQLLKERRRVLEEKYANAKAA